VGALSGSLGSWAQQVGVIRIGWVSIDRATGSPFLDPLRARLRELGYVEGRNLVIEEVWGDGSREHMYGPVAELVRSKPRVIVTQGPSVLVVHKVGGNIPVVFGFSGDPVEAKLVESYRRPGGRFTGLSFLSLELVGKRMELLKELLPSLKRVAVIARSEHPGEQNELRASQAAAKLLDVTIAYFPIKGEQDLNDALVAIPKTGSQAIVAFPDAVMMRYAQRIAEFSVKNRIPAISGWSQFAESGNVMTYGPELRASFGRLAAYVDKILRGVNPAEIPVELPTIVELAINVKAAKALGLTIPQTILVRADRVIE
jgi:putative ABC transport system substrate-binding protein